MSSPILSAAEEQLLLDQAVFHTKTAIDTKINALFEALKLQLEASLATEGMRLPATITLAPGRTYRGENLHALPWRALDCPRHFHGGDMFCFRTLLVWGREFSFHVLLAGHWLSHYSTQLRAAFPNLARDGWSVSQQASPWDWSMAAEDYLSLATMETSAWEQMIIRQNWLKLSCSLPIAQFSHVPAEGHRLFSAMLKALQ